MIGRRRPDMPLGDLPADIQPGDYWKVLDDPRAADSPTGTVWMIVGPEPGYGVGTLVHHTVREHDDGTISVRPGDGSSNSILLVGAHGKTWHGYIEHGDWHL